MFAFLSPPLVRLAAPAGACCIAWSSDLTVREIHAPRALSPVARTRPSGRAAAAQQEEDDAEEVAQRAPSRDSMMETCVQMTARIPKSTLFIYGVYTRALTFQNFFPGIAEWPEQRLVVDSAPRFRV